MEILISEPHLVYAPEMNEHVSKWGVYAIPRCGVKKTAN